MPVIKETIETEMEVGPTFDYVADFENIDEWDPGVKAATRTTPGPIGVGTEYALDLQYGGSEFSMVYRITEWDPPRLVVLEGDGGRASAVDRISFRATPTGTAVDYEADIRMKGVLRLAEPFLGKTFRAVGEGAVAGLDARLRELASDSAS